MKKTIFIIIFTCSILANAQNQFHAKTYLIGTLGTVAKAAETEKKILGVTVRSSKAEVPYTAPNMRPYEFHFYKMPISFHIAIKDLSTNAFLKIGGLDSVQLFNFKKDLILNIIQTGFTGLNPPLSNEQAAEIYYDLKAFYANDSSSNYFNDNYYPIKVTITGNALSNFTSSQPDAFTSNATAGFGLNIKFYNRNELSIIGTVTESRDTIFSHDVRDFGSSILVPGIRKFSFMANYRKLNALSKRWGLGAFVNFTPVIWNFDTTNVRLNDNLKNDTIPYLRNVTPYTFELYFSYTPVNNTYLEPQPGNPIRLSFDLGFVFKFLGGDILSTQQRNYFLGSNQKIFIGLLQGIDLRFSGSHAFFYLTEIPALGKGSAAIDGLTGLQVTGGIGLSANIANLSK